MRCENEMLSLAEEASVHKVARSWLRSFSSSTRRYRRVAWQSERRAASMLLIGLLVGSMINSSQAEYGERLSKAEPNVDDVP